MELHPLTADVMAKLEYDHIDGYDYVLKDDLEIIVSHKLARIRKDPVQDVIDIMNDFLLWLPEHAMIVDENDGLPRFENVNELIRDTVNHYRELDNKNSK